MSATTINRADCDHDSYALVSDGLMQHEWYFECDDCHHTGWIVPDDSDDDEGIVYMVPEWH